MSEVETHYFVMSRGSVKLSSTAFFSQVLALFLIFFIKYRRLCSNSIEIKVGISLCNSLSWGTSYIFLFEHRKLSLVIWFILKYPINCNAVLFYLDANIKLTELFWLETTQYSVFLNAVTEAVRAVFNYFKLR